ncbi:MAG: transporter substrate-binding domain-containing protein [Desulfobacteraceae bacterium]|nr:transporter substrate-binding domain-containing protein [Desulfobacteraceae bacterium]
MKRIILGILILSAFTASAVFAEDPDNILVVRGDGFYPPYEMETDDSQLTGIHIDMVNAVAEKLNLKIQINSVPWKRAIHMMKKGKADAITYLSKTDTRKEFACFFDGNILSTVTNGFFVLKSREHEFQYNGDLKPLRKYTIGMIRGYDYGNLFEQATYLRKDDGAKHPSQLLFKFIKRRFDIGIGSTVSIRYFAKKEGVSDEIIFLKPYLTSIPCYIAFSKIRNHEHLGRRFADEMESFKRSSQYREILKKYGVEQND